MTVRGPARLMSSVRSLSVAGCWVDVVLASLSFLPSLLPRPAVYQGLVTGITAAIGYGPGVLAAWLGRELADRDRSEPTSGQLRVLGVAAGVMLLLALLLGMLWQRQASALLGMQPEPPLAAVLVLPVAGAVFLVTILVARLLRRLTRVLIGWLPGSCLRGAGPGRERDRRRGGARGRGPGQSLDPIRSYGGLDSAPDAESRAALTVDDLERAGGFERSQLLVVTTTGTGWVEPSSVTAFEHLTRGDSATVSLQYSFLPSPLSFLADRENARDSGRALLDAVYERWSRLPATDRPRLYVYGESLGYYGAEAAFSGEFDMAIRIAGAVFTGPPSFNEHFGRFLAERDTGSAEIMPLYRDGRTVRFTVDPRSPAEPPGASWDGSRVLYIVHPSDPITWWNTDLLLHRPDWLEEPRGADVLGQVRWVPFVTFWQVTADMGLSLEPAPGSGHNFTGEHVDAWAQVLRLHDWTAERAEVVREAVLDESGAQFRPGS